MKLKLPIWSGDWDWFGWNWETIIGYSFVTALGWLYLSL
jgi:hypothetical protein